MKTKIQIQEKTKQTSNSNFKKHFRIYFKNGHPAFIVDENGNLYVFHRMTHSKTSGGKKNVEINNPLVSGGKKATYIVKKLEKDKKGRFSLFELELKPGVDLENLEIKKAGGSQTDQSHDVAVNNVTTSNGAMRLNHKGNQANYPIKGNAPSKNIKTNKRRRRKRKHKKGAKQGVLYGKV